MLVEEKSRQNRVLYKLEVYLIKIIPMLYALLSLLNTLLSYIGIDLLILSYIGSVSFLTLCLLYLSSYVFKFCFYHRMFLHYVTLTWILNIIDCYIGIPIGNLGYLCLQLSILGIILFIILYIYVKNYKKLSTRNSR